MFTLNFVVKIFYVHSFEIWFFISLRHFISSSFITKSRRAVEDGIQAGKHCIIISASSGRVWVQINNNIVGQSARTRTYHSRPAWLPETHFYFHKSAKINKWLDCHALKSNICNNSLPRFWSWIRLCIFYLTNTQALQLRTVLNIT